MPDALSSACLLAAAVLASVAGMGWLALSMQAHAQQVLGRVPSLPAARVLRWMGASALVVALGLCLAVDHASMAALVWVMTLTGASLLVAFTLAWRPHWLRALVPWARPLPAHAGEARAQRRGDPLRDR
ncbi:DUF3325 domain-containing protein [Xanthomonas sp. NCPPB 2654]|uniref:DUF3325 domain-containing protein n=1 Tax=unclassified Xanthomonas TaxID=2643310 RepID=UPI0021DF911B|nr:MULTISPECIES: DUF3325 domain-containing protein [unclassified Xanthomonas]MDL5364829.1 DUF3325 domain-containing protein [Xanthomonas sp. NCPPB 2654]UYC18854.1 DUF3325 domain-containing protein [Xanthomonas sp. CFBP 8443]